MQILRNERFIGAQLRNAHRRRTPKFPFVVFDFFVVGCCKRTANEFDRHIVGFGHDRLHDDFDMRRRNGRHGLNSALRHTCHTYYRLGNRPAAALCDRFAAALCDRFAATLCNSLAAAFCNIGRTIRRFFGYDGFSIVVIIARFGVVVIVARFVIVVVIRLGHIVVVIVIIIIIVVIIVIVALAFFFEQLVHVDELELAFARLFAQIAQSPTYPNDANVITRIEPIEPRLKIEQRDVLALINVARQIAIKLVRRIKTLGYRIHDELHQNWVLVE